MIYGKDIVIDKNDFPFDIFNGTGRRITDSEDQLYVHHHDCLEINYVVRGGGYYLIGNKKYDLKTGDICIINNQEYHMAVNTDMLLLKVIVFNVDFIWNGNHIDYAYLKAFFERNENYAPFIKSDLPIAKAITPLIMDIDKEWKIKQPGYRILIKANLMKILALIYRYYEEDKSFENKDSHYWKNYNCVILAADYINSHYSEKIKLGELAQMVHMSENYLSAIFSEIMHTPLSQYIMNKRLSNACRLLKTTQLPITDIALESGFTTVSYFNKAFKKQFGISPGAYRQSYVFKTEENNTI